MRNLIDRKLSVTTMFMLAFLTAILAFGTVWSDDEADFMNEMRQIEMRASEISDYATELEFMVDHPYSDWFNHAAELRQIKQNLNEIGDEIPVLTGMNFDQEWKKEVVDKIAARTKAMKSHVEQAIDYFNNHTNMADLQNDEFELHLSAINRFAQDVDSLVDYVQTRTTMQDMHEKQMTS